MCTTRRSAAAIVAAALMLLTPAYAAAGTTTTVTRSAPSPGKKTSAAAAHTTATHTTAATASKATATTAHNKAAVATTSGSPKPKRKPPSSHRATPPLGSAYITYLVLTYDGRSLTLYVNGRRASSHSEPGPPDPGAPLTEIGGYAGADSWNGAIDDVAVYRTALSPQAIAVHYRLGRIDGAGYSSAVKATPGVADYWRLDSLPQISDFVGHANGIAPKSGAVRWYSLIAGSSDPAIALNGFGTELRLSHVPALRTFTVEAWVLPGPQVSNRTVVSRAGAWFLKTNLFGRWNGGFFHHHHVVSVTAATAARSPVTTRKPTETATTSTTTSSGGTSPLIPLIVLMAIAALAAASIPLRRRAHRGGGDSG